jgi:hypothetical protein
LRESDKATDTAAVKATLSIEEAKDKRLISARDSGSRPSDQRKGKSKYESGFFSPVKPTDKAAFETEKAPSSLQRGRQADRQSKGQSGVISLKEAKSNRKSSVIS